MHVESKLQINGLVPLSVFYFGNQSSKVNCTKCQFNLGRSLRQLSVSSLGPARGASGRFMIRGKIDRISEAHRLFKLDEHHGKVNGRILFLMASPYSLILLDGAAVDWEQSAFGSEYSAQRCSYTRNVGNSSCWILSVIK